VKRLGTTCALVAVLSMASPYTVGASSPSVGPRLVVGQFSVRLNSWKCGITSIGTQNNGGVMKPTKSFCLASLTATNISNIPAEFDGAGTATDNLSRSFISDDADLGYANENEPLSYNFYNPTINPTFSIRGNIVFDVPKNDHFRSLTVQELNAKTGDLNSIRFFLH